MSICPPDCTHSNPLGTSCSDVRGESGIIRFMYDYHVFDPSEQNIDHSTYVTHAMTLPLPFSQLVANTLVFLAVNVVGLFVHNLMEHAQRRAFLDTR